jgi:hypothetical protein
MMDYLGLEPDESSILYSPASTVALIGAGGQLLAQFGKSGETECVIREMLSGSDDVRYELPARELYALATVAQSIIEVTTGQCESFSRECTCRRGDESYPCVIEVEPYLCDDRIAGALLITSPLPNQ